MEPKPVDLSKIKRAKTKAELVHLLEVELVPIPEREEKSILEKLGDRLPYLFLRYGKKILKKFAGKKGMPSLLKVVLRVGASGVGYAAGKLGVKQK